MSMVTSCTLLSRAAPPANFLVEPCNPVDQQQWLSNGSLGLSLSAVLQRLMGLRLASYPLALVHPNFPPRSGNRWRIKEEEDYVKLWFHVGDKASKDNLEVQVEDDVLLVRSKSGVDVDEPLRSLDVRLLVPKGYDTGKMEAELTFGSLLVTIGKHKPALDKIKMITISPKDPNSIPKSNV